MFAYPPSTRGRTTGHADPETTEGLRADLPAGNVDSHNIVCSWCAHIAKGEATSGAILASRLAIHGTKRRKSWSHELPFYTHSRLAKKNTERRVTPYECIDGCSGEETFALQTLSAPFGHLLRIRLSALKPHDLRCVCNTTDTDHPRREMRPDTRRHCEKGNSRFLAWTARQTFHVL